MKLYRRCINKSETLHMLRGNIAATSLKMLWKDLYSVYDESIMNVFTLSLLENFRTGLIYFDQFSKLQKSKKNSFRKNAPVEHYCRANRE